MIAEVIAIGDELTSGQRLDTNTQWLSERLTGLGVRVMFHTTVGDQLAANVAVFRAAIERADVVVCTGGLGPTADDLTREAIAEAAGVGLYEDAESLAHVREFFASRGRTMPERNLVQAMFPRGSRPIPNPQGTAPGIRMALARPGRADCLLFALPGVPLELFAMWPDVAAQIAAAQPVPRVIRHRRIKCFGAGESHIEERLPDLIRRGRVPEVGITVSHATITLRITAEADDHDACLAVMGPTAQEIYTRLGPLVFGEEEDELEHVVVRLLASGGASVATAEVATCGMLAQWLAAAAAYETERANAMNRAALESCFRGGVVLAGAADGGALMALGENQGSAAFPAEPDNQWWASPAAAEALAAAVRSKTGADFGLAVAGLPAVHEGSAASSGERPSPAVPARLHVALADAAGVRSHGDVMLPNPQLNLHRAAKSALNMLRLKLVKESAKE